jgi:hypothetical protein
LWPVNQEYATMYFFRFSDNVNIIDHWVAIQKVSELKKKRSLLKQNIPKLIHLNNPVDISFYLYCIDNELKC